MDPTETGEGVRGPHPGASGFEPRDKRVQVIHEQGYVSARLDRQLILHSEVEFPFAETKPQSLGVGHLGWLRNPSEPELADVEVLRPRF